jgi:hypothetical protein
MLLYLIFAHLLGDFILQPSKLVLWKSKSIKGTFVHASIHFLVTILVLLPFIINGYTELIFVALGVAFVHFWIDEAKINYDLKHDKKVYPFLVDQFMHLITITAAYFLIASTSFELPSGIFYSIYGESKLIMFLAFLVILTTVIEIFHFQREREKNKFIKMKINSEKMMSRIIIFSILYSIFLGLNFYFQ